MSGENIAKTLASARFGAERTGIELSIAGVTVQLEAPAELTALVDSIFSRRSTACTSSESVRVTVEPDVRGLHVEGTSRLRRYLPPMPAAHPAVSIADFAAAEAARFKGCAIARGAVLAKEGRALALRCDDGDDATLVAMHLVARNWKIVSVGHAVLDACGTRALPVRRNFSITSASLGSIPRAFKRSVEVSPWFSLRDGLHFYSIDSEDVRSDARWTGETECGALVLLDGDAKDPALAAIEPDPVCGIARARLGAMRPAGACTAIERWWERLPLAS